MNKKASILYFLFIILVSCLSQKSASENKKIDISGNWDQVEMTIFNSPGHMVGPNGWHFKETTCTIKITNPREYSYEISYGKIKLRPKGGNQYDEWEHVLLLNGDLNLNLSDSTMVWTRTDSLYIKFIR